MYNLFWRDTSLPFTQKQVQINVPPGAIVTNAASLRLTGKGFTNYGKVQQENLLRLLENFAAPTAPSYPTVGQLWYDTSIGVLKICVATAPEPETWEQLNAYQVSDNEPLNPTLGDMWFKKTGVHSGILYVYDGIGRFPEKVWDAVLEGYYQQPSSPTLVAKVNSATFNDVEGSTPGSFVLFGKDSGGVIQNTQGSVLIDGVNFFITHDLPYFASVKGQSGYLMVDTGDMNLLNSTFLDKNGNSLNRRVFFVVPTSDGSWVYDNGSSLVKFTPTTTQFIFGILETSHTSYEISSIKLWRTGVSISRFEKFVLSNLTKGKCGGWQQIWPAVDYIGARDEFDAIYNKLMQLIGDPIGSDGSGAINKLIDFLPNLEVLDASYQTIIAASGDVNIFEPSGNAINTLKVLPTSQDWDLLLAACRYAVNRLEVAADAVSDIPAFGFVQDGLPLHPTIMNANPTDVKFLSSYVTSRKTNKKMGVMSCFVSFQELMNTLDYAIRTKHIMKGTYENSAATSYQNVVVNTTHATFTGNGANVTGTKTLEVVLPFKNTHELESFLNSGGTFMFEVSAEDVDGVTPIVQDATLKSMLAVRGKIKVTGSNTIIFNYGSPSTVSITPINTGFDNVLNGASTTVSNYTLSGVTLSWGIGKTTTGEGLKIIFSLTTTTPFTNTINVRTSYIMDDTKYANNNVQVNVFGKPLTFDATMYGGTGVSTTPTVYFIDGASNSPNPIFL